MATPHSILILDDDLEILELVASVSIALGIECAETSDPKIFWDAIATGTDMILLDLIMPGVDGIEIMRLLGRQQIQTPIVIMSGIGREVIEAAENLAAALGLSIVGHLRKPFRVDELESILLHSLPDVRTVEQPKKQSVVISDQEILVALDRSQFTLHYQPQIAVMSGKPVGIEALVRWRHPSGELVEPDNFLPRIEKLHGMEQLTWIVAREAASDMVALEARIKVHLSLSINISVHSLHDLQFPERFVALMESKGLPCQAIILEITESGIVGQLPETLDVLTRLRMKNVQLSIDDFGTGYSMMQQLRRIPATEIKIDKGFVQRIHGSPGDRVLVQKTIEIGHDLNMTVVAEGVETHAQLDFLGKHGCDRAQGYLFAKPLPVKNLREWLSDKM